MTDLPVTNASSKNYVFVVIAVVIIVLWILVGNRDGEGDYADGFPYSATLNCTSCQAENISVCALSDCSTGISGTIRNGVVVTVLAQDFVNGEWMVQISANRVTGWIWESVVH